MKLKDIQLNNWGRFDQEPGSFTIQEYDLPRPWSYIYTSDDILLRIDHKGCGYAQINPPSGIMLFRPERYEHLPLFAVWFKEPGQNAFTNFFNPIQDLNAKPDDFECTFKPEYAEYKMTFNNWQVKTRLSISSDSPSIIMRVNVENLAKNGRELDINPVWRPHNTKADLALWDVPELYQSCKFFNNHGNGIMVETRDPDAQITNRKYTVMLTDLPVSGAELKYEDYIGRGNAENPEALYKDQWMLKNDRTYELEDFRGEDALISQLPIAALQSRKLSFKPGESIEFSVVLHHLSETDYRNLAIETETARELLNYENWKKHINAHHDLYNSWMNIFKIETPDAALNQYTNEWLILQLYWVSKLDRGWPTGMRGTRDAAQDYSGLSYLNPDMGRAMLEEMFACQRKDGSFLRQFSCKGPEGKHDERDYVDSGCWVFELLYDYLCLSGDNAFMNKTVGWLDAEQENTIRDHAKRLLEYYMAEENHGEHGLVKIKGGDWNDSINNAGLQGVGESVMVSCQVVYILEIAQDVFRDDKESCELYVAKAAEMKKNLRKYALNDAGFLNGIFTDGRKWVFSDHDQDGAERLNCPVNSFGIIAGIFEKDELENLFNKMEALKGPSGYRLFYPPLGVENSETIEMAGRMGTGDLYPGNAENGTVYNHGSQGFLLRAMTEAGEGERALKVLRLIFSYDQNLHPVSECKTEPYGVLNCWNEIQGRMCEGEKVFLSGTISTVFRGVYNGMMGIKPRMNGLEIKPCLPESWQQASCKFFYRSTQVKLSITKSDAPQLKLNGKELEDNFIPAELFDKSELNKIEVSI